MKHQKLASVFFAAAMLAWAASAGAVDGTIEINDAAVKAAGVYPYNITGHGSYRLTGNLTAPAGTDAILVTATDVTIDLNGFRITGSGSVGISAVQDDVTVENGTVTGFATGVDLGMFAIVRNVHADVDGDGIIVGLDSLVKGCTANNNTDASGQGISAGGVSVISGNTASGNAGDGIVCAANACVISGNTASSNSVTGIDCKGSGCLISSNTVHNNATDIAAKDSSTGYTGNVMNKTPSTGKSIEANNSNQNLCNGSGC